MISPTHRATWVVDWERYNRIRIVIHYALLYYAILVIRPPVVLLRGYNVYVYMQVPMIASTELLQCSTRDKTASQTTFPLPISLSLCDSAVLERPPSFGFVCVCFCLCMRGYFLLGRAYIRTTHKYWYAEFRRELQSKTEGEMSTEPFAKIPLG